ncbi:MAG: sulfatase-like hydrolase/transferase [bacterium]|nr:sulfatase-like hydrolase/transferase [bacterium]
MSAALLILLILGASSEAPAAGPPSIVLISIDTLRSDRLPAYGYRGVATPAIDALRRDAILFERVYSPAPLTMPAHASILTGLLPAAHGVRDNIGYRFDSRAVPYLPRLLREHGYATGAAVSAYVLRGVGGFADGFDHYEDSIERRPRAGVGGLQRSGRETLQAALPWLRSVAGERFFFFFHLFEPHTPYAPPEPFASRYGSAYDGEVAAADRVVGELLAELRRLGVYESALIVLLSDHGEGLGDHGEEEHGILLYRESLQVPLVLKLPRSELAGRSVAAPAQLLDVAPTLLAVAGLEPPPGLPGMPLPELVDGEPAVRPIYSETHFPRLHFGWSDLASLIEGRYHYIGGPVPKLFDLVSDTAERKDLLRDEPRVGERLRAALAAYDGTLEPPAEIDSETRRALAALGYVVAADGDPSAPLPDPESRLPTIRDLRDGLRYYAQGELGKAVASYRKAVAANPRSLDAWEYLGRSLSELDRSQEALEAFAKALDIAGGGAPHLAAASVRILLRQRRFDEALVMLRRELGRSPREPRLQMLEAQTLLYMGRFEEALKKAEETVRADPGNADGLYLRGAIHMGRKDLVAGERDLRRALELAPDHTAAMSDLAVLLQHRGELSEARELYKRVLSLRPGDALATRNLRGLEAELPDP